MKPTLVRIILVSLLLAVQLATVVIVVMGMRNQTETHVAGMARQSLQGFAERVAQRSNQLTDAAQLAVLGGRRLIASAVLDARSDLAVERFLLSQLQVYPQVARMQLARVDGSLVEVNRVAQGYRSRVIRLANGLRQVLITELDGDQERLRTWVNPKDASDPRNEAWYISARQSSRPVWTGVSDTLIAEQPTMSVASISIHPDTTDAGVLGASISTKTIAAQLGGLPLADNSSVSLIDSRGNALAYLTGVALEMSFDPVDTPPIELTVQPPIRRLFNRLGIDLASEDPPLLQWQNNSGFTTFDVDRQDYFGMATPVPVADGQMTWLLTTAVPATSYLGGLSELFKRKMRTLLAVILIPALIAVLALFGLNDPVAEAKEDTETDELTGFLNRSEFRRRLEGMLRNRRELEYGGRIVVATLDMDGFGKLTDRHGRETGDAVLRQFSRRLRNRVRQHDLLGRTGPDKFLIALRVDRGADVLTTVNRIRRATVVKPFVTSSGRHMLGVTAGIAAVDPNETVDDLLARADQALVTGKVRHRNRSYLAAAPDNNWPQTGIALPNDSTTRVQPSPTLEI